MSATESLSVLVDREKLIDLLVDIEAVVNFHNDLAGVSPAPITDALDRAAFEFTRETFGEILTDQCDWVGIGARVDTEGRERFREAADAVFGLAVAS